MIEEDQVLYVVVVHAVEDEEVYWVEEYLRVVRIETKRREDRINFLNEFLGVFSSRFASHFARGFNLLHNLFFHSVELLELLVEFVFPIGFRFGLVVNFAIAQAENGVATRTVSEESAQLLKEIYNRITGHRS